MDNQNKTFNFDSFFNKQIVDSAEKISDVVSRLNDEDFDALCVALSLKKTENLIATYDTNLVKLYSPISFEAFLSNQDHIRNVILDLQVRYKFIPGARICQSYAHDKLVITVHYTVQFSRDELTSAAVVLLGKRKGKIIAKRLKRKSEKQKPELPKTMVIDGVEYILTPKIG